MCASSVVIMLVHCVLHSRASAMWWCMGVISQLCGAVLCSAVSASCECSMCVVHGVCGACVRVQTRGDVW